ncbi:hypothetical protein [Enterobacter quasiroggenkampii]|uniref:hypothetical protein n=1 Tax=Enterobacter quasiroggenkampii TaxID=2497436 RepID=UPI0021D1D273|nr:hypothetical protein [Enterobacter quasiroggenkampii]MCU6308591.1 hypothetical protein [Enterobacter quasiroggenkampii]
MTDFEFGLEHNVETVWDARVWHHTVTGSVATRDYNYRTASTPMDAKLSVRNEAATI